MSAWHPHTLVKVDERYDQERASDGKSRYGVYLGQHPDWFHDFDEPGTPLPAAYFAAAAWRVATEPIMWPGYVRVRPDVAGITVTTAEDDSYRLVVTVGLPLEHDRIFTQLPSGWRDWERDRSDLLADPATCRLVPPSEAHPAVLVTAQVRLAVPDGYIPQPTCTRGPGLVQEAKAAVQQLAEFVNDAAGPAAATLQLDRRPALA